MLTTFDLIETLPSEETPEALRPLCDEEGGLRVAVTLSAVPEMCDYGVAGSPVWIEAKGVEVESFEVNGEEFTPKQVAAKFGWNVHNTLQAMALAADHNEQDWS